MKKIIVSLVASIFITSLYSAVVRAKENNESYNEEVNKFSELQKEIDDVLYIEDGKYIFEESEVIKIVNESDIDFNSLSEILKINITKELFLKDALYQLKNTQPNVINYQTVCSTSERGTYCGRNASAEGWNYVRKFSDKKNSEIERQGWLNLYERNMDKNQFDTLRDIQELVPSYARIAIGLASASAAAETSMAIVIVGVIGRNNTGNCGTVTDINKYTRGVSGWSQDNYWI